MEPKIITVSGPPGSGTTTLSQNLSEHYGLPQISGGDIFREMARNRNMSEQEFGHYVNNHPRLDRELDERLHDIIKLVGNELERTILTGDEGEASLREKYAEKAGIVVESRLAGWIAGQTADFRIWCTSPQETRIRRINNSRTENRKETQAEVITREQNEAKRYQNFYGVDIGNLSIYDLVINTSRWGETTTCDIVTTAINKYETKNDEGKTERKNPIRSTTLADAESVEG